MLRHNGSLRDAVRWAVIAVLGLVFGLFVGTTVGHASRLDGARAATRDTTWGRFDASAPVRVFDARKGRWIRSTRADVPAEGEFWSDGALYRVVGARVVDRETATIAELRRADATFDGEEIAREPVLKNVVWCSPAHLPRVTSACETRLPATRL